MSTRIYNTALIPTSSLKELTELAREISKMETAAFLEELANGLCGLMQSDKGAALRAFYTKEGAVLPREAKVAQSRYAYVRSKKNAPFIFTDQVILKELILKCRESIPGITGWELSYIITALTEIAACHMLSFVDSGFPGKTLMKWYSLTEKTTEWIRAQYQDFDYQDSTDGPELQALEPEFEKHLASVVSEYSTGTMEDWIRLIHEEGFWHYTGLYNTLLYPGEAFPTLCHKALEDFAKSDLFYGKSKNAVFGWEEILPVISNALAYTLYRRRGEVWNKALGEAWTIGEGSLGFSLIPIAEQQPSRLLAIAFRNAVKKLSNPDEQSHIEDSLSGIFRNADMYTLDIELAGLSE